MEAFRDYVKAEYNNVQGYVSTQFTFTHTSTVKIDKASQRPVVQHTISVRVQFYDKDMNLLHKAAIKFVNNKLPKKAKESLVNISPDELENRFMAARREIVEEIFMDYDTKRRLIDIKIEALQQYLPDASLNVIPEEFNGERIQIADDANHVKQQFDM